MCIRDRSAGNKGQVKDGREKIVVSGLNYGNNTRVIFSNNYLEDNIEVADSRYYIKGVRLSGRDTGETADLNPVVTVNGDADYVVAYGVVGDQVAYTVQYQDADGNELAPSRTFYGNIGDKPIAVSYTHLTEDALTGKVTGAFGKTEMTDTKLTSLPSTGGIGTTIFTIGGCAIMIAAAALYFVNRRKSEEN